MVDPGGGVPVRGFRHLDRSEERLKTHSRRASSVTRSKASKRESSGRRFKSPVASAGAVSGTATRPERCGSRETGPQARDTALER